MCLIIECDHRGLYVKEAQSRRMYSSFAMSLSCAKCYGFCDLPRLRWLVLLDSCYL